jgi:hypothetical protein
MEGTLYCLSNPSMPGLLKIGIVVSEGKLPHDRAKELFTTGVPTPFEVEFARTGVKNPVEKESTIHGILERHGLRVHPRREFFRLSPDEVRPYFALLEGEWWTDTQTDDTEEDDEEEDDEEEASLAVGQQFWSVPAIRRFIEDEWKPNEAFKTEGLYYRLVTYCQAHGFSYYAEKEGVTKPHISGLGCILRKHFVNTGILQTRRIAGHKALYYKATPPLPE